MLNFPAHHVWLPEGNYYVNDGCLMVDWLYIPYIFYILHSDSSCKHLYSPSNWSMVPFVNRPVSPSPRRRRSCGRRRTHGPPPTRPRRGDVMGNSAEITWDYGMYMLCMWKVYHIVCIIYIYICIWNVYLYENVICRCRWYVFSPWPVEMWFSIEPPKKNDVFWVSPMGLAQTLEAIGARSFGPRMPRATRDGPKKATFNPHVFSGNMDGSIPSGKLT